MIKGKSIAKALIILLLIFIGNDQAFHYFPSASTTLSATTAQSSHVAKDKHYLALTAHTIKKDKIRVRYINGECYYDGASLPAHFLSVDYPNPELKDGYASFVYSSHHFIFKLRGPPLC